MAFPLVIAHRGSSESEPEHTLAAYQRAVLDGADGWECDVRLTRDGHLVCVHDRKVDRTSNGAGPVSRHRLVDLQSLDFTSWKDESATWPHGRLIRRRSTGRAPEQVLTLEKLLEFFVDNGRDLRLLVETKHPTRYGGLVERRLVEMLRRFNLDRSDSGVTVMSMWPRALRRVHQLATGLPTAQLLVAVPPPFRGGTLPYATPIAGPWLKILRAFPQYVQRAQAVGKKVYTWTIDEPADVEFVAKLGVDAIITNRPAAVRAQLTPHP